MRLSLLSRRVPFLKLLIVVLLIANLLVGGARIVLGQDGEAGNPPDLDNPISAHLGCADISTGAVRVFRTHHSTFGTRPLSDCTPAEYRIVIYFAHDN